MDFTQISTSDKVEKLYADANFRFSTFSTLSDSSENVTDEIDRLNLIWKNFEGFNYNFNYNIDIEQIKDKLIVEYDSIVNITGLTSYEIEFCEDILEYDLELQTHSIGYPLIELFKYVINKALK